MNRMRHVVVAIVAGALALAALSSPGQASAAGVLASPQSGPSDDEMQDYADYASAFGVSLEEAQRVSEAIEAAGKLQEALAEAEPDHFGGLWVEHNPFAVLVSVVQGGEKAVQALIDENGLAADAKIVGTDLSLRELILDQVALGEVIPKGVRFLPE